MISTKLDQSLLYEIKRFHSDNDVSVRFYIKYKKIEMSFFFKDIAQICEDIMIRIRQRS
jgi:hypothetical protein